MRARLSFGETDEEKEAILKSLVGEEGYIKDSKGHLALTEIGQKIRGIDPVGKNLVIEDKGFTYLADNLKAGKNVSVAKAMQDDSLRCNQLFAVTLISNLNDHLSKNILLSCEQLLVPGAIRSLANKTLKIPSPIYLDGELINNPENPYIGHYLSLIHI